MHLSLFLGPISRSPSEDLPLIDLCIAHAIRAAEAGFAMVTFGEQHFNNYEPYCNPLMMGARLAGNLGETWFGTTVMPLPLHGPLRLAENISLLDLLMRGRLLLGLSAGRPAPSPDMANFGLDVADREKVFASKLQVLLQLLGHDLGEPPVVIDTPWDKGALRGRMMPMSYRAGRPLIAIGTSTEGSVVQTAASGWPVFLGPMNNPQTAHMVRQYEQTLASSSHDAAHADLCRALTMTTKIVIVGKTEDEAWERAERMMAGVQFTIGPPRPLRELANADLASETNLATAPMFRSPAAVQAWLIVGTPESVVAQIQAQRDLGLRHLNIRLSPGPYSPADMNESFELFVRECAPALGLRHFPAPQGDSVRSHYRTPPPVPAPVAPGETLFLRG